LGECPEEDAMRRTVLIISAIVILLVMGTLGILWRISSQNSNELTLLTHKNWHLLSASMDGQATFDTNKFHVVMAIYANHTAATEGPCNGIGWDLHNSAGHLSFTETYTSLVYCNPQSDWGAADTAFVTAMEHIDRYHYSGSGQNVHFSRLVLTDAQQHYQLVFQEM
jgi:heat shock protein HslJ